MKNYLIRYDGTLTVKGPVFIGSGKKIEKNEYLFLKNKIGVMDVASLYDYMNSIGKGQVFEEYLITNEGSNLSKWLTINKIKSEDIMPYMKYIIDSGDFDVTGDRRGLEVLEFMRDTYGKPFIPGSSIKGMLRTILLSEDIMFDPNKHVKNARAIKDTVVSNKKGNRKTFLRRETNNIEGTTFRTLFNDKKNPGNAVNDIMKGIIISDSEVLDNSDLVLCQKIEMLPDGNTKKLNLLRECLKPGTKIKFTVTIDTSIFKYNIRDIENAISAFSGLYYENFSKVFAVDRPMENDVYLGGGCGFVSKTIIYPMFEKDGVEITQQIFKNTGVTDKHKHYKDKQYGVSPHILKCTSYKGNIIQMGVCSIDLKENVNT